MAHWYPCLLNKRGEELSASPTLSNTFFEQTHTVEVHPMAMHEASSFFLEGGEQLKFELGTSAQFMSVLVHKNRRPLAACSL